MELVEYLKEMDCSLYGLTRSEFIRLAYGFAQKNNIANPLNWNKNHSAGNEWSMGFNCRHPEISQRKQELTIATAKGTVYNMDETGIQINTNIPPKILSVRRNKKVGAISSAERGTLTTVICCCNAMEAFIPPFLIFV
ncbi:hypothetical protein PR048_017260 [Dryococelus australis]|uniref:Transposase n=1 Tax=Dryococelus australis TaxID=614101 RepID=A0ABQ9H911_9NEOP|nr:hypothetical protein PR048_017260 [Dryococelus australis]